MGELDAATRRIWGFGEEPVCGEFSHELGAGERAKLGIRNASTGSDRGRSELSEDTSFVSLGGVFALVTWCMPDGPLPGLPFPELQRPQMGLSGLP
jgi:hypothetical protein